MKESSTSKTLRGKVLVGYGKPVSGVEVYGQSRRVTFKDGSRLLLSKAALKRAYDRTMAPVQRNAMLTTMVKGRGGVIVQVGGMVRGETRKYKTEAAAKAALTRKYGKS